MSDTAAGPSGLADGELRAAGGAQASTSGALLRNAAAGTAPVRLSQKDKAPGCVVSEDGRLCSSKGYRMARCTHGVSSGAWFCEVSVEHLGTSGHARLGWATCNADLNAPVGFDEHGYGFRSGGGERLHRAQREAYGVSFGEGDVVGLYITLGAPEEAAQVLLEGETFLVEQRLPTPPGAADAAAPAGAARVIAFAVNGVSQGVAFAALPGDVYFPAISLFTDPLQPAPAAVVANFGPQFAFPPSFAGLPRPRSMSELGAVAAETQPPPPAA